MIEDKKHLFITVSGTAGSGKSRLTYLLKQFLKESGFEVNQILNEDHPTEANFDKVMSRNRDEVTNVLRSSRTITLQEQQIQRGVIHPEGKA